MPQIKEYGIRSEVPGAINTRRASDADFNGMDGLAEVGQGIQVVAQGVEAAEKRREQDDNSRAQAAFSKLDAEAYNELNETVRNAAPKSREEVQGVIKEFMDKYTAKADQIGEGISTKGGQRFFIQKRAAFEAEYSKNSNQMMAQKAGEYTVFAEQQSLETKAAKVYNNPSSFESVLKDFDMEVEYKVSSRLFTRTQAEEYREKSREEFAEKAFQGWVNLDWREAKAQLDAGTWDKYFSGDRLKQAELEVGQAKRAEEAEIEAERIRAKRVLDENREHRMDEYLTEFHKGSLTLKTVLTDKRNGVELNYQQKEHWIKAFKAKDENKDDSAVLAEMVRRMHLPPGDPNRIDRDEQITEWLDKGLRARSIPFAQDRLKGKGTLAYDREKAKVKVHLDVLYKDLAKPHPVTGITDPEGLERYQKAAIETLDYIDAQKPKGRTVDELLNTDSPHFVGKHVRYRPQTLKENIKSFSNLLRSNKPPAKENPDGTPTPAPTPTTPKKPRLPGESFGDWKKRAGF